MDTIPFDEVATGVQQIRKIGTKMAIDMVTSDNGDKDWVSIGSHEFSRSHSFIPPQPPVIELSDVC